MKNDWNWITSNETIFKCFNKIDKVDALEWFAARSSNLQTKALVGGASDLRDAGDLLPLKRALAWTDI